jgi:tRNA(Leu) C34 or U34 (ribose-2'-O)-methylase TrmL
MREPNPITAAARESGEPEFRQIGVGPWAQTHPGQPRPDDRSSANFDERFDPELLDEGDRRNVLDRYRYWSVPAIKDDLDRRGRHGFEVAVENWTHDFNIGSMVRTANAFAAKSVHIVGPHKWNRKGSLMTELYQHVDHHPSIEQLVTSWREGITAELAQAQQQLISGSTDVPSTEQDESAGRTHTLESGIDDLKTARVIALDIIPGAVPIETYRFPNRCLMLFGAEGPGLSQKALELADDVVYISQFGSVRSINAGAAAAVAMHCWIAQHGV